MKAIVFNVGRSPGAFPPFACFNTGFVSMVMSFCMSIDFYSAAASRLNKRQICNDTVILSRRFFCQLW